MEIKLYCKTVRGELINKLIFGEQFKSRFEIFNVEIKEPIVDIKQGKFRCKLCGRWFQSYRQVFYHVAVVHKNFVDKVYENIKSRMVIPL